MKTTHWRFPLGLKFTRFTEFTSDSHEFSNLTFFVHQISSPQVSLSMTKQAKTHYWSCRRWSRSFPISESRYLTSCAIPFVKSLTVLRLLKNTFLVSGTIVSAEKIKDTQNCWQEGSLVVENAEEPWTSDWQRAWALIAVCDNLVVTSRVRYGSCTILKRHVTRRD